MFSCLLSDDKSHRENGGFWMALCIRKRAAFQLRPVRRFNF